MKPELLESETFSSGNRTYFIDFKRAVNNSDYIKISRSDRQPDNTYKRNDVVIFEDDFFFLIESFSMLFSTMAERRKKNESDKPETGNPQQLKLHGIKSWDPEKRPREKLMAYGPGAMADAELLAILISSGNKKENAVTLSARILKAVDYNLNALAALPLQTLMKFKGIGEAKALSIMAAMELSKRRTSSLPEPFTLMKAK